MARRDYRDIIGGVLICALGAFVALYAQRYSVGSLRQMGPGYFPTAVGLLMVFLGLLIAIPGFLREGAPIKVEGRSLLFVVTSLVFFSLTLQRLGLIFATGGTVLLASLATAQISWGTRLALMFAITLIAYVVFILGLRMILPIWP
jgi:hypothetical protein